jgi:hypothetical protein
MPKVTVDGQETEASADATVLQVRGAGSGNKVIRVLTLAALLSLGGTPAAAQDDTAARVALHQFGQCVASTEPVEAARVMALDFTSTRYRTALRLLADEANRDCGRDTIGIGNEMRSGNLLMAGAIAEGLLASGPDPVNVQLVRAAAQQAETYSPTDAVAQCLARSLPDQTGALFATVPGSAEEATAVAALQAAVPLCGQAANVRERMELSDPALRAMVATAAFRLVAANGSGE